MVGLKTKKINKNNDSTKEPTLVNIINNKN